MKNQSLRGVWTALITPFNRDLEIDLPAFRKVIRDQIDAGVTGIIPCGTTGETPALSREEKQLLIRTALEEAKGSSVKVIAGTGSNNTAESVEFSRWAAGQGVDGLLVVTPYYNKPTQAGLEAHFRAVADAVEIPIMLYNVPGRTGVSLTAETVAKLAEHPRITSLKEATGNPAFTSEVIDALEAHGRKLEIFSGDDATYLPLLSVGGAGVVSVSSNLFPRGMIAIQRAFEAGKVEEAFRLHQKYYPLFRDLFVESNPGPIKAAMAFAGFCEEHVRLPLATLSATSRKRLQDSLARCEIAPGRPS